jgi:hypothetical protein
MPRFTGSEDAKDRQNPTRTLLRLVADYWLINFCGGFLLGAALFAIVCSEKMGTEIPESIFLAVPGFLVILLAGIIPVRKKTLPGLERMYALADDYDAAG